MDTVHNAAYELTPAEPDLIGDGNEEFQELKVSLRQRLGNEHNMILTETGAQVNHGRHYIGSARAFVQAAAPTSPCNPVVPASFETDEGRMWLDTDTNSLYVYHNSAWVLARQDHTITISTTQPTGAVNGDIWIQVN